MRPNSHRLLNAISLPGRSSSHEGWRVLVLSTAIGMVTSLAGCGSSPATPTDGSRADAPTGVAGDGGTSTTLDTGTASDGDAANVDATDADTHLAEVGSEAGSHCSATQDHASFRVYPGDGTVWMCNPPALLVDGGSDAATLDGGFDVQPTDGGAIPPPSNTLRGVITGGDASSLVIDSCEGNPSCVPNSVRIEISAPGLDLTTVPRVRVEVTFQFNYFYSCQESLQITATESVDGSASSPTVGQLLLAVVDGGTSFVNSPYTAARVPLGCFSGQGTGNIAPDDYAFDFSMAGDNGPALRVYMGETHPWMTVGRSYRARNLRSFQSIASDDFGNFAYYIVAAPP